MFTSNFARAGGRSGAVAIAQGVPKWYRGRIYRPLAPSWALINTRDEQEYTRRYRAQLERLDPAKVAAELGPDAILLCWEKPGDFCHRRLVAKWLEEKLGIQVPELPGPGAQQAPLFQLRR